ncbi:propanediol/glycerol family dehydratase large subunit [Listeria sp. FSL L7-1435]|uniref:Propanediol/glycerol family dehydratase large subunit n=1 Tax=Listeria cossartiae subsp. cayugensis TaxID=2713505 RepID=A0A7X1DB26_9LIST|nr:MULTISPECIES: propanediol/glycerol family dehydratase large subunit [Listeria]EAC3668854.1 propanediol/glycerol family dehydratase large subunit [Listeria monocytogenes]EAE7926233.1 propanediol/glycerol family dehydratase large subunit [Listeria monocytogenes]EAG3116955.1 propanediol/glycerol family dehydratase large subunit [Listeria monocytogenes]ECR3272799.1 propanediol/glycerol family dehydratase large subunit [Listeria monocytogenes]EKZ3391115.1 propanediol/glycerol family dehydratase 
MKSKRFEELAKRPVNQDGFVKEWIEEGLIAMESPNDPKPSIKIENGKVVEMDSKKIADFDLIDHFIAKYGVDLSRAEEVMQMDSVKLANMLCDPNVPREKIVLLTTAMTPAKIVEVVSQMNVVEMMMSMQKMRSRRTPTTQAHVTNLRDNPVQIAADAAEAAIRGFDEQETTVAVVRYAPFNALSLLVGSQTGRGGVLTQCSLEEATELELGMRGLTCYAETISVYGTEPVFTDGDDTPWSKGILASAYASRGLKMRFTSGTGSEVQMGYAEGKSMLYLESRCIFITKAAGVQGLQNGSISCIGIPGAVPSGIRAVLAENLIAVMLDLEVASGNDQTFSHSDIRRTARLLMQFLPGTDYISSGYSATPNYDNMFAGSNFDADDFDDYNILQRDLKVDGGLTPVTEEEVVAVRNKAARVIQAVFDKLGLPEVTDAEVEAATYARGSKDMPERNMVEDIKAAAEMMDRGVTGLDVVKALSAGGFDDVAESVLNMLKQRVSGDFLHTSAIIDKDWNVISSVNDLNDYAGPGTGYRLEGERWEKLKDIAVAVDANELD